MEKQDFETAIAEIFQYFRFSNAPDPGMINSWHEKVEFIPIEALPWIVDKIEEMDGLPRNLPKLIKSLWFEYRRQNKDKSIVVRSQCNDCGKMGFFFVRKESEIYYPPLPIDSIIICAACNNYKLTFGADVLKHTLRMTKGEIIGNEYQILPHDRTYAGRKLHDDVMRIDKDASVAHLTKNIGNHINHRERKVGNIPVEDEIPF